MASRQILPENNRTSRFESDQETLQHSISLIETSNNIRTELETVIQPELSRCNVDESVGNQTLITSEDISRSALDFSDTSNSDDRFESISPTETESCQFSDPFQDYLDTIDVICERCITHTEITHIDQLQPGDHIRFHRKNTSSGLNIYNHHAIVISVDPEKSEMTLVHFTPVDGKKKIVKNIESFEASEGIDKIEYPSRPFTAKQIVQRADEMAERYKSHSEEYEVFTNNCEHKANKVTTGNHNSLQVSDASDSFYSSMTWPLKLILKISVKLFTSIKDYIRGFAPFAVLGSLISLINRLVSLKTKLKNGLLCLKCYQKQYSKLMTSLVFCLITVCFSVLCHVGWLYFSLITIITVTLPCILPFLIDKVFHLIQPAANVPKPLVRRSTYVRPGDVITFPYIGLYHEGVVTRVKYNPENRAQTNAIKASIVHYNFAGLFGTRTVVKEDVFFNLDSDCVYVYNFGQQNTLPPEEVISNAIEKVGEQKFNMLWNRSSHMAGKCKTGSSELKYESYFRAKNLSDLSPGDVIDFKYMGLSHQAVLVSAEYSESLECSVVHYNYNGIWGRRSIVEDLFLFNLSDENLYVHNYTGIEVYDREEVVQRAKSKLGEQKFNTFTNRSSHFADWCKVKHAGMQLSILTCLRYFYRLMTFFLFRDMVP